MCIRGPHVIKWGKEWEIIRIWKFLPSKTIVIQTRMKKIQILPDTHLYVSIEKYTNIGMHTTVFID